MSPGASVRDPLVALREGNPAPFEEFVHRRTRSLIAYFVRQGAAVSRAEDLAQDVFVKLYRSAGQYRPQERFDSYCFRVARNVWIDDCRKLAVRGDANDAPEPGEVEEVGATPELCSTVEEEQQRVATLLSELPPAHRRVFELVLLGELSYAEIGSLLAIPVGTVKSRMFHAVRRLRQAWTARAEREGVA